MRKLIKTRGCTGIYCDMFWNNEAFDPYTHRTITTLSGWYLLILRYIHAHQTSSWLNQYWNNTTTKDACILGCMSVFYVFLVFWSLIYVSRVVKTKETHFNIILPSIHHPLSPQWLQQQKLKLRNHNHVKVKFMAQLLYLIVLHSTSVSKKVVSECSLQFTLYSITLFSQKN